MSDQERQEWLRFTMRWQQFTGPIAAKGVEDTALYLYTRLLALNEVGSEPGSCRLGRRGGRRRRASGTGGRLPRLERGAADCLAAHAERHLDARHEA